MTLNLNLAGHADASGPEMLVNGRFRVREYDVCVLTSLNKA